MSTTYAVCHECKSLNKYDPSRADQAKCGRCKKPLPVHGAVSESTRSELSRLIESSPVPVVVDFWASWYAPCRAFAPTFAATAQRRVGATVFTKVNTELDPGIGQDFGIRGIPTLIVFSNGKEVARISGAMDQANFERWLDQVSR